MTRAAWSTTPCKACGALIFYATTAHSERMPIDAEPTLDGNLAVSQSPTGIPNAVVIRPLQAEGMRAAGQSVYRSHFASCPAADDFRKRARNKDRAGELRRRAAARSRNRGAGAR